SPSRCRAIDLLDGHNVAQELGRIPKLTIELEDRLHRPLDGYAGFYRVFVRRQWRSPLHKAPPIGHVSPGVIAECHILTQARIQAALMAFPFGPFLQHEAEGWSTHRSTSLGNRPCKKRGREPITSGSAAQAKATPWRSGVWRMCGCGSSMRCGVIGGPI